MNVNELAERESARVERMMAGRADPELVKTIKVSVWAAVAFAYGEGRISGALEIAEQNKVEVLDWSGDRPRINNIKEWIK